MKRQILELLRNRSGIISGETIRGQLGISRVSVWKHIKKLQECGYPIESTPKGYLLNEDIDALYPWEFPEREENIHFFDTVSSTMDVARELARNGCPNFSVVAANQQLKGRGRLGRQWISSQGGIYITVIVRPNLPASHLWRINFCASLTMMHVLRNRYQIDAKVKWPNDILVNGKKICGILCEIEAEPDRISFVNVGIGLNVNNDPSKYESNAISIYKLIGKKVSRKELLTEFLDHFENEIQNNLLDDIVSKWKKFTITIGKTVKVVTIYDTYEGIAMDIDNDGALILQTPSGEIKKILHGDCFHQEKNEHHIISS